METTVFASHPISIGLLIFGLLFLIPTVKVVVKLSIDSTPLQWLLTMGLVLLNSCIIAVAMSFLNK